MVCILPPVSPTYPLGLRRSWDSNRIGSAWWAIVAWLSGLVLLAGCGSSEPAASTQRPLQVGVAVEPVAFLVDRLAGPNAQVQVLIPPGADAHTFQLSPQQMADLAQADVFFRVGLALEDRIVEKLRQSRPDFPVVDLSQGIPRRRMQPEELHSHREHGHEDHAHEKPEDHHEDPHGDTEEHGAVESGGWDPHIWLSPPLLKVQAQRIAQALAERDPAHVAEYRRNLAQLETELDGLHAWISEQLAPYRGRTFLVFHPSFGYFADCYGLRQRAVQQEGKTPTPQELRQLIQQAQRDQISVIFVQPQFDRRAAQVVADAIGARLVEINDLDRHVLETLHKVTQALVETFRPAQPNQQPNPAPPSPTKE